METSAVTKVVTLVTLTDGKGGNGVQGSGGRDKSVEEHWKLCRLCKSYKIRV